MSYPFFAIRLNKLSFSPSEIGAILGISYLFSGVSGIFLSNIGDQLGSKKTMIASLLIGGCAFIGLGSSESIWGCLFLNMLLLSSAVIFEPSASSLMLENSPEEQNSVLFRYRYIAINLGASAGPFIGGFFASLALTSSFVLTGVLFFIFAFFLFFFVKESETTNSTYSIQALKEAAEEMRKTPSVLYLIGAIIFISMTYCQMFTTLPQILSVDGDYGTRLYVFLLMINPVVAILAGLFSMLFFSRQNIRNLFIIGCSVLLFSFLGFHFSPRTYLFYGFFMIVFTLGEVILMPASSKYTVDLASKKHVNTYLGIESCYHLGFFSGNIIGGFLLQKGASVFLFCAFCSLVGLWLYQASYKNSLMLHGKVKENG